MEQIARRFSPTWLVLLAKAGKLVSLLKVVKVTKVLVTASTMLVSMLAYDLIFDPWFSFGFVILLFVHEMGHVIALRRVGMETPAPVFIPFLGAAIFIKDFRDRVTEAYIGYGGPLLGTLGTLVCLVLWWFTEAKLMLGLTFIGAYLNLFNMLPVRPLDGGRITQVIGDNFKYLGFLALAVFTIYVGDPSLLVIWLLVMMDIRMPRWWRTRIGLILLIVMIVLFVNGYGERSLIADIIDIFLASMFIFTFFIIDSRGMPQELVEIAPYPAWSVRLRWLALYLGLTIGLWTLLAYTVEAHGPVTETAMMPNTMK